MSTGSIADSRALRQSLAKAATEKETSDDKVLFQKQAVKIKLPSGNQKQGKKEEFEGLLHKHPKNLKTENVQENHDKKTTSSINAAVEQVLTERSVKRNKPFDVFGEGRRGKSILTIGVIISDMGKKDQEGAATGGKVEFRCEKCPFKYESYAWFVKHMKKAHDIDYDANDESKWEVSINPNPEIPDSQEEPASAASFAKGVVDSSSQNPRGKSPISAARTARMPVRTLLSHRVLMLGVKTALLLKHNQTLL